MNHYTATQMREEIERAIRTTRESTLAIERTRVTRNALLYANTCGDEKKSEGVLELLSFLYECRDTEVTDDEHA